MELKHYKKWWLFFLGTLIGATILSIAFGSVPKKGQITDDSAIYQNLSDIRVPKAPKIDFDADIARLNQMEDRYKEKLPSLKAPMERVAKQKYRAGSQGSGSSID